jgi:GntP family gluconate:H+ symporter
VGFIILVPIVYGFCKAAGVNPIKFGLPVAGIMLAAHVVVPPHPGIVGGAAIVKGDIGWITIIGLDLHPAGGAGAGRGGLAQPQALPHAAPRPSSLRPSATASTASGPQRPGVGTIMALILIRWPSSWRAPPAPRCCPRATPAQCAGLHRLAHLRADGGRGPGHVLLGRNQGWNRERTNAIMESALPPAATVILVTGAGGVFAKVLTASGIGAALSQAWPHPPAAHPAGLRDLAGAARRAGLGHRGHPHHLRPAGRCDPGGGYSPCRWRCSPWP